MSKTGKKSHLCQNDKTYFCSNLYRAVKNFTELCRSNENPEYRIRCTEMHIPRFVTLELMCDCFGIGHWSKNHESASETRLVRSNLGRWRCSSYGRLQTVGRFVFGVAPLMSSN